jgi:molecular chaperone GrpE (heat shock protein)
MECIEKVEGKEIAVVEVALTKGYRLQSMIIRPAKVVVGVNNKEKEDSHE